MAEITVKLLCVLLCAFVLLEIVPVAAEKKTYGRRNDKGQSCTQGGAALRIRVRRHAIQGIENTVRENAC